MVEDEDDRELLEEPGPAVTRELFLTWRAARRGQVHAEDLTNPVWEWLVRSRSSAYQARQRFKVPDAPTAGPGWCCDRFGQSSTHLPDGRVLLVSGEHEDHYDPDFFIYNDVIVLHPDGRIEIFGYPKEDFPPTDAHSATLIGDRLILIGNLGYPEDRRPGETQVLTLEIGTWRVSRQPTSGEGPSWIHEHEATLDPDGRSILVRGGMVDIGGESGALVENNDDWRLWLDGFRWERLTRRTWPRFELRRVDGRANKLFEMENALWHLEHGLSSPAAPKWRPPDDPILFRSRYVPPVPHERLPSGEDDDYRVVRIGVDGVTVRYLEDMYSVVLTIEGDLPVDTVNALRDDLHQKLERLEETRYEAIAR